MTAVGPEFYKFIKELEESGDKAISSCTQDTPVEYAFNNPTCHVCNGYYGPSFGEPVCVTCHAFLFPDLPSYMPSNYLPSEEGDDCDSGNDEPSDLNYNVDPKGSGGKLTVAQARQVLFTMSANPGLAGELSPDEDIALAVAKREVRIMRAGYSDPPPPPAHMRRRPITTAVMRSLQALSTPRLPDNLTPGLVQQLPSEVLLGIFSYLDDMSLSACACVCARWSRLVHAHVPGPRWRQYAERRWPLHRPWLSNIDSHRSYQSLLESCFCRKCLVQMSEQIQPAGEEGCWRRNRLTNELKMMRNDPLEGIAAIPLDAKSCHWQGSVTGPVGSPYEGGIFYLYVQVPYSYPMSPPVVRFLTRILHPNVSRHGDVGIDSVHHNWTLALTISKVLISIQSLLTDPYTKVCMEPEVGEMYAHDRPRFEALARQWTWRYAMQDVLPPLNFTRD